MSENKTLKDAPIGEWIECDALDRHIKISLLAKGKTYAFGQNEYGQDVWPSLGIKWRYPIDPLEELENKLLELWRGQDVAYAWDEWKDIPHRWILQVMLDAGADPAKL